MAEHDEEKDLKSFFDAVLSDPAEEAIIRMLLDGRDLESIVEKLLPGATSANDTISTQEEDGQ